MSIGVRVGPVWASTSGRRRYRHRHGPVWWALLLLLIFAGGGWISATAGAWIVWSGAAVLLTAWAVAKVRRVTARRARRRQRQVRQAAPTAPLNERMHYSNRR